MDLQWQQVSANTSSQDHGLLDNSQICHTTQVENRSAQPFSHSSWQSVIGHIGATWRIWLNSCFLRPSRVHNRNNKSISSAVFAPLMAESPYTLQWVPLSPKIATSYGASGPPSDTWFLGPIRAHNPNGISISSAVFAQMTIECPYTLQWDAPFPLKIATYYRGGSGRPSNTWFPGPPKSSMQTASRSVQSFLLGSLVWQIDRQTTLLDQYE